MRECMLSGSDRHGPQTKPVETNAGTQTRNSVSAVRTGGYVIIT